MIVCSTISYHVTSLSLLITLSRHVSVATVTLRVVYIARLCHSAAYANYSARTVLVSLLHHFTVFANCFCVLDFSAVSVASLSSL